MQRIWVSQFNYVVEFNHTNGISVRKPEKPFKQVATRQWIYPFEKFDSLTVTQIAFFFQLLRNFACLLNFGITRQMSVC